MSYRNPRYTYVSHAPYYQSLIDSGVKAGQQIEQNRKTAIAKEEAEQERKRKINDARVNAARGANQAYVTAGVQSNTYGNKTTKGAIGNYFADTGAEVGDLTMRTTGPDAPCEAEGNCAELTKRLATLRNAPAVIKDFTEMMLDQVSFENIQNFDENQGGDFILAANILGSKDQFTPAYGYSYDIKEGIGDDGEPDGTYDWVFSIDKEKMRNQFKKDYPNKSDEEIQAMIDNATFGGKDSFSINSGGLEQMTANGGSVFVQTPLMSKQMQEIITGAEFLDGAEFDEKGNLITGSGTPNFQAFLSDSKITTRTEGISEIDGKQVKNIGQYNVIDYNKVANKLDPQIQTKVDNFFQQENQGEATAFWNKVLSKPENIDAAAIEEAIGYDGDDPKQKELAGHLSSLWNSETKSFKAWDYNNPEGLCGTQQPCPKEEAFAYLFKKYATDEVVDIMNKEAYRSGRAYTPEEESDIDNDYSQPN